MGQLWPILKPSLDLKKVRQEHHQDDDTVETEETTGIKPETPRKAPSKIKGGKLRHLDL